MKDMKDKLYKLMNWPEIEAIIYSEEDNPHRLLGPHAAGNATVFQTFWPGAEKVELVLSDTGKAVEMELADEGGCFAALVPGKEVPAYEYRVTWPDGTVKTEGDPYRFAPVISKRDTDRQSDCSDDADGRKSGRCVGRRSRSGLREPFPPSGRGYPENGPYGAGACGRSE